MCIISLVRLPVNFMTDGFWEEEALVPDEYSVGTFQMIVVHEYPNVTTTDTDLSLNIIHPISSPFIPFIKGTAQLLIEV